MSAPAAYKRLSALEDFEQVLSEIDHVLLDCDGVVWNWDHLIGNAKATIELFRKHGKGVAFVSNNATSTRAAYVKKFRDLGIDVDREHIFTSGTASARYLKDVLLPTLPEDRREIYMIGPKALTDELEELGLTYRGGLDPEDMEPMQLQDFSTIQPNPNIGVVLASFDMYYNYKKMSKAFNYLSNNPGCALLLSNDDIDMPLRHGGTAAGEGAIAAPLRLAAKGPIIVAGKPNQPLLDAVLVRMGFERSRTLMVGDRLETDIIFGNDGNIKTLLVLSGCSRLADIQASKARPDYVCDSLGQIADLFEQAHRKKDQRVMTC